MMRKTTTCFLVMAIAFGCSQAPVEPQKPIDPPIEKQPSISIEPEKPVVEQSQKPEEETRVKKIDVSKDWVHRQDGTPFESNSDIGEWIVVQLDQSEENENIYVNVDSDDAKELNVKNTPVHTGGGAAGTSIETYKWYVVEDYLILLKKSFQGPQGSGIYHTTSTIFDLNNGSIMNVDTLLDCFAMTRATAQENIENQLFAQQYETCGDVSTDKCFFDQSRYPSPYTNFASMIDEGSVLYVNPDGNLEIVINGQDNVNNVAELMRVEIKSVN